jgi:hypothetical protein
MVKAVVLHLLAVAAGWGIVVALRSDVSAAPALGAVAVERSLPTKSVRTRPPAEVAAGKKILQRLMTELPSSPDDFGAEASVSFAETLSALLRKAGFDPAAPAPLRHFDSGSPHNDPDALEYHDRLRVALESELDGSRGPDLAHAFRHGRVDAVALYDSLAAAMPGAAANDALRLALYDQLAPLDPVRAAALLQPLSADAATGIKYESFKQHRDAYLPDAAYALLSSIPTPADASAMIPRQSAWLGVTPEYLQTYGSDYLHWVEQLPAGTDRDWAAVALMVRLRENDLPAYRRMRAVVTDPRMLNGFPPR